MRKESMLDNNSDILVARQRQLRAGIRNNDEELILLILGDYEREYGSKMADEIFLFILDIVMSKPTFDISRWNR